MTADPIRTAGTPRSEHGERTVTPGGGTRRVRLLVAAALLLLPVLAGCGADQAPGDAAPGPGPVSDPTATAPAASAPAAAVPVTATGLDGARRKEIAMELVSSAENSSLNWKAQYKYIEDIGDGRGYTAGIIGFCSGTGDLLDLVQAYTATEPGNPLAGYLPALRNVNGSASHEGLGAGFTAAWVRAAADPVFQRAQDSERDKAYFTPAVALAKRDGLGALGQFIYYDAAVMHGTDGLAALRSTTVARARPPAAGGDETAYLNAFLVARRAQMRTEAAHSDTSRVDTEQQLFLDRGDLTLAAPLHWKVYDQDYSIPA